MLTVDSTSAITPVPAAPFGIVTSHDSAPRACTHRSGWRSTRSGRGLATDSSYSDLDSYAQTFSASQNGRSRTSKPVQTNDGWPLAFSRPGGCLAAHQVDMSAARYRCAR